MGGRSVQGSRVLPRFSSGGHSRCGLRRQGRNPPILRIRDQRCSAARKTLWHGRAQPDLVVVVYVCGLAVGLIQPLLSRLCILEIDGVARRRVDPLGGELLVQRGRLLFREELLPGQVLGSLQGG